MTPLYKIIIASSKAEVYAKMERANPTGTHKDRSMAGWLLAYKEEGEREFVISSSGNSAVSAAKYCQELGLKLHVFLSEKVSENKVKKVSLYKNVELSFSKTPKKDAMRFARDNKAINLRSSVDDRALEGYKDIAYELIDQIPQVDNIFIPTSSGTTLEGIYMGYRERGVAMPELFAVQTAKVHPIAEYFDTVFQKEEDSYADAIVDNIAHRRDRVVKLIIGSKGGGYVISNRELKKAREELAKTEFQEYGRVDFPNISPAQPGWQSVLAYAGFLKWKRLLLNDAEKSVSVCLFTD